MMDLSQPIIKILVVVLRIRLLIITRLSMQRASAVLLEMCLWD